MSSIAERLLKLIPLKKESERIGFVPNEGELRGALSLVLTEAQIDPEFRKKLLFLAGLPIELPKNSYGDLYINSSNKKLRLIFYGRENDSYGDDPELEVFRLFSGEQSLCFISDRDEKAAIYGFMPFSAISEEGEIFEIVKKFVNGEAPEGGSIQKIDISSAALTAKIETYQAGKQTVKVPLGFNDTRPKPKTDA